MSEAAGPAVTGSARVSGRAASLEELLTPLLAAAYGTALRLTRNPADAEDLVQDAAYQAARGFGTFTAGTNFRGWFFRILTNCFYSRYRKAKREGTPVELEDTPELYLFSKTAETGLHQAAADPAGALMDRLDTETVTRAIEMLPEEYRLVATLYFMQDCQYQEIAEMLGVPIGTVRSRLHRGRRMLQKLLWELAEERGVVTAIRNQRGGDE